MRVLLLLCLLVTPLYGVELVGPASTTAGSGELIRVTAQEGGQELTFRVNPATLDHEVVTEGGPRVIFAAPGVGTEIDQIHIQVIDWENRSVDDLVVMVQGSVDPTPPEPVTEFDVDETYCLIIYESDETDSTDATRSPELDEMLRTTLQDRWRLWDKDVSPSVIEASPAPEPLKRAYARAQEDRGNSYPWLVLSDQDTTISEPLSPGISDALSQLRSYLGSSE